VQHKGKSWEITRDKEHITFVFPLWFSHDGPKSSKNCPRPQKSPHSYRLMPGFTYCKKANLHDLELQRQAFDKADILRQSRHPPRFRTSSSQLPTRNFRNPYGPRAAAMLGTAREAGYIGPALWQGGPYVSGFPGCA